MHNFIWGAKLISLWAHLCSYLFPSIFPIIIFMIITIRYLTMIKFSHITEILIKHQGWLLNKLCAMGLGKLSSGSKIVHSTHSGDNLAVGKWSPMLLLVPNVCDSQAAINGVKKSLSKSARSCPKGKWWAAFLTASAHVLESGRKDWWQ